MKQNHDIESKSVNDDATIKIFQCPVCGGHRVDVAVETYGMREIVGVGPGGDVLFGYLDNQEVHFDTCHCRDCEWTGGFFGGSDADDFEDHLVVTRLLRFTCPDCGGHELRRISLDQVTSCLVSAVYQDPCDDAPRVGVDNVLGCTHYPEKRIYACGTCQYPLKDEANVPISHENDLIAWLKNNQ